MPLVVAVRERSGLRISEALALAESDLDPIRGSIVVRAGRAACAARSAWPVGVGIRQRLAW